MMKFGRLAAAFISLFRTAIHASIPPGVIDKRELNGGGTAECWMHPRQSGQLPMNRPVEQQRLLRRSNELGAAASEICTQCR